MNKDFVDHIDYYGNTDEENLGRKRRCRTNFTEAQSVYLEQTFQDSHYPDQATKKILSERLGIPEDRITVWFQNRRAKWRRKEQKHKNVQYQDKTYGKAAAPDYSFQMMNPSPQVYQTDYNTGMMYFDQNMKHP
ncbi:unnamed protein product [Auanema sp. JU1783]|nr:unnamed protein product [Auanema sp. JU1783]